MNISIRRVEGEEMLEALYFLNQYAFHPTPPLANKEEWLANIRQRQGLVSFAAFEEGKPVSIVVSMPMTQNMRGALYPASGVAGVATHPSARRKGYVRQAMASLLEAERARGAVFTNLYPFRESFYERLGYVSFPIGKIMKTTPRDLALVLKMDLEGEVELLPISEAYETYRQFAMELRQGQHGMAVFDLPDQTLVNRNRNWVAIARVNGVIEGMMLYSLQGEDVTKFNFFAWRFYYRTRRARYLLLQWIARHVDQADRAEIWLSGEETPETWISDMQVKMDSPLRAPMGRVLDVAKTGGMEVGEGSFAARITDLLCPWNEGAWRFEGCDGRLVVTRIPDAPLELTIQGLSALAAGAYDPEDFSFRGWGRPDPALQNEMRALFPKKFPYIHESF